MKKHNIYFLAIICTIASMVMASERTVSERTNDAEMAYLNMVNLVFSRLSAEQILQTSQNLPLKNAEEIVAAIKELPDDIRKELDPHIMLEFNIDYANNTGARVSSRTTIDAFLWPSAYTNDIPGDDGGIDFLPNILLARIERLGNEGKLQAISEQMKRIKDLLLKQQRLVKEYKKNSEACKNYIKNDE